MSSQAELIEASLLALAERGVELRHGLFERFFAAFPARRAAFLVPEATSIRMTDETLQMLYGLAQGEEWVWPLVAELVATHRSYGTLPLEEYHAFVDMVLLELAATLGKAWTAPVASAWQAQAQRLKAMITDAAGEWDRILPQSASLS